MKRRWQQASGLMLLLIFLAGCESSGRKLIGVVPKATSHLFWVSVQAGAMAAGQDYGLEVIWNGPASERASKGGLGRARASSASSA